MRKLKLTIKLGVFAVSAFGLLLFGGAPGIAKR